MYKVICYSIELATDLIFLLDFLILFLKLVNQSLKDETLAVIILLLEFFKEYLEGSFCG